MDTVTTTHEKPALTEVEDAKEQIVSSVPYYTAATDEEKALDRRVNLKLDMFLLVILAVGFIVRLWLIDRSYDALILTRHHQLLGIDKTNVGFVATSTFIEDANLKPDDIPNSLSLVCPMVPIERAIPLTQVVLCHLCPPSAGLKYDRSNGRSKVVDCNIDDSLGRSLHCPHGSEQHGILPGIASAPWSG